MLKTRPQVIQTILDLYPQPHYLEIGVSRGETFHTVKAACKVAVDPRFLFNASTKEQENVHYFEITSDDYFGNKLTDSTFQVIYLDGLHTFEQTLRDLISAVTCLAEDGVIVIDDVIPNSFHASLPDVRVATAVRKYLGIEDPSWMGDVYKLVFFVQTFFQRFSYATISDNHGQLILWREPRPTVPHREIAAFPSLSFADVVNSRDCFQVQSLETVVQRIRTMRA
jgi:Methyltransferase domain